MHRLLPLLLLVGCVDDPRDVYCPDEPAPSVVAWVIDGDALPDSIEEATLQDVPLLADATVLFTLDGGPLTPCEPGYEQGYLCAEDTVGRFEVFASVPGRVAGRTAATVDWIECALDTQRVQFALPASRLAGRYERYLEPAECAAAEAAGRDCTETMELCADGRVHQQDGADVRIGSWHEDDGAARVAWTAGGGDLLAVEPWALIDGWGRGWEPGAPELLGCE